MPIKYLHLYNFLEGTEELKLLMIYWKTFSRNIKPVFIPDFMKDNEKISYYLGETSVKLDHFQ